MKKWHYINKFFAILKYTRKEKWTICNLTFVCTIFFKSLFSIAEFESLGHNRPFFQMIALSMTSSPHSSSFYNSKHNSLFENENYNLFCQTNIASPPKSVWVFVFFFGLLCVSHLISGNYSREINKYTKINVGKSSCYGSCFAIFIMWWILQMWFTWIQNPAESEGNK